MKIAFGCDPNAAELKQHLLEFTKSLGHEVTDYGSDDPIYANVAIAVATDVAAGKHDRGVLVCGTGIGVSIAANKVPGAYAANIHDVYQAERAQLSNNANIVTFGQQVIGAVLAQELLRKYLSVSYDPNSRSGPKVDRVCEYEATGE
ncbi:MAG: RpiB/LacA/LacB family sugar-phosphate isomerase [Propionibacteriaceae bacterium]|jgi:ribose 5-phosphate isomerase B|nr:RpiB/LacA/LacB family sugar-phosphate isomerase [Propionibacteriaceae bacterium]